MGIGNREVSAIAATWGTEVEESALISVIGSGPDLNSATDNGLARAAELLEMSLPEVKNRATITGAIEIGRHPGVVQVTFRAPLDHLAAALRSRPVWDRLAISCGEKRFPCAPRPC